MWQEVNNSLYQKFEFANFVEAFGFMSSVALISEKCNHHPTWKNTYHIVEIWLSTHDAGNVITQKDYDLAREIEKLI
jgi:4a-hydroxytetrahydrobiopterin dehydratase